MKSTQRKTGVRRTAIALAGLATVIALASCGGSDDNGGGGATPPPPVTSNEPPASASASVTGFIDYLLALTFNGLDTIEPLDLTNFTAPVSDNTEPDPRP